MKLIHNSKFKIQNCPATRRRAAFTLIELMIVVSILGIMAAIVLPELQGHTQKAKESSAKSNLKLFREAIERYQVNNSVPPGYPSNDTTANPGVLSFNTQLFSGNYLTERPKNPFNDLDAVKLIGNAETFPASPVSTNIYGWIYQPATKTVKLNTEGTDSTGIPYFDY